MVRRVFIRQNLDESASNRLGSDTRDVIIVVSYDRTQQATRVPFTQAARTDVCNRVTVPGILTSNNPRLHTWPIGVIDLPPASIVEALGGENTREADLERAILEARGGDKRGLLVGRLSSHAFRNEKSFATRH